MRGEGFSPEEFGYLLERLQCYYPDLWALYEERAAIMEYDGGLSREDAERQAYVIVVGNKISG